MFNNSTLIAINLHFFVFIVNIKNPLPYYKYFTTNLSQRKYFSLSLLAKKFFCILISRDYVLVNKSNTKLRLVRIPYYPVVVFFLN